MCLGSLSYDYYTENKIRYTGLYGNIYDFSVDYSPLGMINYLTSITI